MKRVLPCGSLAVWVLTSVAALAHDLDSLGVLAERAYEARDFDACGERYEAAIAHGATDPTTYFNAACCKALAGDADGAIRLLQQAVDAGFTHSDHLAGDSDLESLHQRDAWTALLARCERRAAANEAMWDGSLWRGPYSDTLDAAQRIAGLSKLWAEVKLNFANFDLVPGLDWDSLYVATIPEVTSTTSTEEYYRSLMRFCARVQDGHTYVKPPKELFDRFSSRPALRTRLVEDRVLLTRVVDPALREMGFAVGQEVVAIDGIPVRTYGDSAVAPMVSASTPQDLAVRVFDYELLTGDSATPVELRVLEDDGTPMTRSVLRLTVANRTERFGAQLPFELEQLDGHVAWVKLNTFNGPEAADRFLSVFDEIAASDGLILDVRDNGGGNSSVGYRVLATLTDEPFLRSAWWTREYRPVFRAWGRAEGRYRRESRPVAADGLHRYTRPVIVLTSARTYSAAEDFCIAFDAMGRGLLVGEATGGSTGQPLTVWLPGGGYARICSKRDLYPDGREMVGRGVQPDRVVRETVASVRAGEDPVLQVAIEEISRSRR